MSKLIIKYIDGKEEELNRYQVTPTGLEMRNTSKDQLKQILSGDGRRLIVYEPTGTRIIIPNKIRDIIIDGESIFIEKSKGHQCGVWCDEC